MAAVQSQEERHIVYAGDLPCGYPRCTNKASYVNSATLMINEPQYLCGTHSRSIMREELPKMPRSVIIARQEAHLRQTNELAYARMHGEGPIVPGHITLYRMRMMHGVPLDAGILNVFPNFRSGNGLQGGSFCCAELSPKAIGPVNHGQPGLPPARSIENFHQGSKKMADETEELFHTRQREMFEDPIPRRHKDEKYPGTSRAMEYFEWIGRDGVVNHLTYVQSRQFYCNFYERAISAMPAFQRLVQYRDQGYNLRICGYDAFLIEGIEDPRNMSQEQLTAAIDVAYMDAVVPFGHERVIFTMLVIQSPVNYPWRRHKAFDF